MVGGSDGCINLQDVDNKGLGSCVRRSGVVGVYEANCHRVSLADFIVIAAEAAMGRTATSAKAGANDDYYAKGTLARTFRDNFRAGRETAEACDSNKDRMPDPEDSCLGERGVNAVFKMNVFRN